MKISLSVLQRISKVSRKRCREKNTFFIFNNVFPKIMPFTRYVEKRDTVGQTTDNNMAHAHYMLDNQVYKHTPRIRNTLLFQGNNGYSKGPQCYRIRKLPVVNEFTVESLAKKNPRYKMFLENLKEMVN